MSKAILRRFIRVILESDLSGKVAEKMTKAIKGGFGMHVQEYPNKLAVTLYDTAKLIEVCSRPIEEDSDGLLHFSENAPESIVAYVEMYASQGCDGAMEVTTSMAKDRFGPLIYDLAMAASPGGIVPDRQAVSEKAREMYLNMFHSRSDVVKTPVPDTCKTWEKKETEHLNYIYSGGSRLSSSELQANNSRALTIVSKIIDVDLEDLKKQLSVAGWVSGDKEVKKASGGTMHYYK